MGGPVGAAEGGAAGALEGPAEGVRARSLH